jgi:hypothetical protein
MQPESIPLLIRTPPMMCSCRRPLHRERAEWKGASRTTCERCGLLLRLAAV